MPADRMHKALSTALPPEVAARLGGGRAEPTEPKPEAPAPPAPPAPPKPRTRPAKADLGELDLGERIRQITTRMPISLADRLDIAVLRQKRTGGAMRSIQAIMLAGAERVLDELESRAA